MVQDPAKIRKDFWTSPEVAEHLARWVDAGLAEDAVAHDLTSQVLFENNCRLAEATIFTREAGVLAGLPAAMEVFRRVDAASLLSPLSEDGALLTADDKVLRVVGTAVSLLGAERLALNLLSHLSGISSQVARWTQLAAGASLFDTRKTLPGLRLFQKYAVLVGGGVSHRGSLAQFPLVKDNHRALYRDQPSATHSSGGLPRGGRGEIIELVSKFRGDPRTRELPLEIEVDDYNSFAACLEVGVDLILIDNQTPETIQGWLKRAHQEQLPRRSQLEASGGITADNLACYGASGVHRISIGALTHSVKALDFSMDIHWVG